MSNSQDDIKSGDQIYYTDQFTAWCELDFGEGFLAPGGREEVAKIISVLHWLPILMCIFVTQRVHGNEDQMKILTVYFGNTFQEGLT